MNTVLGATYKDIISGFEGVATGRVEYITGCNQALLTPRDADSADKTKWFDEQRLQRTDAELVVLDNGETPGCDIAAPIR